MSALSFGLKTCLFVQDTTLVTCLFVQDPTLVICLFVQKSTLVTCLAIKERLTFVEGEIAKLDAALGRGVAEI